MWLCWCIYTWKWNYNSPITVPNTGEEENPNNGKNIIIKNCAPFTNCISEISNT